MGAYVPSLASVAVGAGTVVSLRVLGRLAPRLLAALFVLAAVTIVVAVVEPGGVALRGDVPSGLPAPAVPTPPPRCECMANGCDLDDGFAHPDLVGGQPPQPRHPASMLPIS